MLKYTQGRFYESRAKANRWEQEAKRWKKEAIQCAKDHDDRLNEGHFTGTKVLEALRDMWAIVRANRKPCSGEGLKLNEEEFLAMAGMYCSACNSLDPLLIEWMEPPTDDDEDL